MKMVARLLQMRILILIAAFFVIFPSISSLAAAAAPDTAINLSVLIDPEGIYRPEVVRIAAEDDLVAVIWNAFKDNGSQVFFARSIDGGAAFQKPSMMDLGSADVRLVDSSNPLAVSDNAIHLLYDNRSDGLLYYVRSLDGGASFEAPKPLGKAFGTPGYAGAGSHFVLAEDANVLIAWTNQENNNAIPRTINLRYSTDKGGSFSETQVAADDCGDGCIYRYQIVDMARSGDYVYLLTAIFLQNDSTSQSYLDLYSSSDGGKTFGAPQRVNVKASNDGYYTAGIGSYSPKLAADGAEVQIVWINIDNPGSFDGWKAPSLRTLRSTDGGRTLQAPQTLHIYPAGYQSGAVSGLESISRNGDNILITETRKDLGHYVWRSTDGGQSFNPTELLVTQAGWWPKTVFDPVDTDLVYFLTTGGMSTSRDSGETFGGRLSLPWSVYGRNSAAQIAVSFTGMAHLAMVDDWSKTRKVVYRRFDSSPPAGNATNQSLILNANEANCDFSNVGARCDSLQLAAAHDLENRAFSVEFWFKFAEGEYNYSAHDVLKKTHTSPYPSWRFDYTLGGNCFYGSIRTSDTGSYGTGQGCAPAVKGQWTHLAMTYDADAAGDNFYYYVNGVENARTRLTGDVVSSVLDSAIQFAHSSRYPSTLLIDELRLWDVARTPSQIASNFKRPLGNDVSGLVAYLNFNGTLADVTGRHHDGWLTDQGSFSKDVPPLNAKALLSVSKSGNGTVTSVPSGIDCGNDCSERYDWDTQVTLTAKADSGYRFERWSGACTGTGKCVVKMTTAKSVTARFVAPPVAPAELTAAAKSTTEIALAWKDRSNNETGFKIERRIGSGAWAPVATVGANVTKYVNIGLIAGQTYGYRVRAVNAAGNSAYSNVAQATTRLVAPTELKAAAKSTTEIALAWKDRSNNETGFKIERRTGSGAWAPVATVGANVTKYVNIGLIAGQTYGYRVRAVNAAGNSAYSNVAQATTWLVAPTELKATAKSATEIALTWKDRSNNETGFRIERKTGATGTWVPIVTVKANVTSYRNTGLQAKTQYVYRVRAVNAVTFSAYSNEAGVKTP